MKHEIIYTEQYALVVSDEQIKDVRLYKGKFHLEKGYIINQFPTYLTDLIECKLIIAHRPLTDAPILEGVPLLSSWSQQDNAEELAKDKLPYLDPEGVKSDQNRHTDTLRHGFKTGYNKAKETYIEILKSIESLCDNHNPIHEAIWRLCHSVQKPKRPKYFQWEVEQLNNKPGSSYGTETLYRLKTITNSQGQTELIGEYIF
jgi:hypothetical protein